MRFRSVRLKNYRGIDESFVDFSDKVTIIEADNEVGKSSIPEAIRLLRTMPASSNHKNVLAVVPTHKDAGPEVELVVQVGDSTLTYRKRWKKAPLAELKIQGPAPASATGREAHDLFEAFLASTCDMDLLDALEVQQGQSLNQPVLSNVAELRGALNAEGAEDSSADTLLAAVEAEYRKYFGKTGKPVGSYKTLREEASRMAEKVEQLTQEVLEIEKLAQKRTALADTQTALASRRSNVKRQLDEATGAVAALQQLQKDVDDRAAATQIARAAKDSAASDLAARAELIEQVQNRRTAHERAEQTVQSCEQELNDAQSSERLVAEELKAASKARREAETQLELLEERLTRHRGAEELEQLRRRLEEVRQAEKKEIAARSVLSAPGVDQDLLATIRRCQSALDVAERTRSLAAPLMEIDLLGDTAVYLDGELLSENASSRVTSRRVLEVPDTLRVAVAPGSSSEQLDAEVAEAHSALEQALAQGGVKDLQDAETNAGARERANLDLQQAQSALRSALGGEELLELEAREAYLAGEIEGASAERDLGKDSADIDPRALEAQIEAAREALAESKRAEEALKERLKGAAEAVTQSRESAASAQATGAAAKAELAAQTAALEKARAEQSDADLELKDQEAQAAVDECEQRLELATQALAQAHPEKLELEQKNARALWQRVTQEVEDNNAELHRIEGELSAGLRVGPSDRLREAEAEYEHVEGELAAVERRASAAGALWEELTKAAEQAQDKYLAPLKQAIEQLGRVTFAPDFSVSLTQDLQVASRTLGGVTVPFDSLSAGAREQIALLSRLACAQLVDAAEGAPLILDDVLGFADPTRLKDFNAAIAAVGDQAQIIILTCQPDRFANVGGAAVRKLQAA